MNHVFKTIHKKMKGFANTTVVVSENASSLSKATDNRSVFSENEIVTDLFTPLKRVFGVGVTSLLFVNSLHANIIADPNAAKSQQPTILYTASGATQVNIQTPTAAGISMNQYTQFDTKNNGTVINNSRTNTNTLTAGWVQGNPWLATGSAKAIVNQVNSSNPSNLTGNIEIAGSKADFIVANPSGISVNGANIINAGGTTLTTGKLLFNNGNLDGFNVNNGTVSIQGAGLNALGSDYINILAHAAAVNASLWANELKVITGTNTVSRDGTNIAANTTSTPAPLFAIDSSALGGMYANKITLIGTQSGVGVNNAGVVSASSVSIDANGMLTNSGIMTSSAISNISSTSLDNSGSITSQGNNAIKTQESITNTGTISSLTEGMITTSQLDNTSGEITAGRLEIAANTLNNTNGSITQTGLQELTITTANLNNANDSLVGYEPISGISGDTNSVDNSSMDGNSNNTGSTGADTSVGTLPSLVTLAPGSINIADTITNDQGGKIVANGAITLNTANTLTNSAVIDVENLNASGQTINNDNGQLNANNLNITAISITNTNAKVQSNSKTVINSSSMVGDGEILSNGDIDIDLSSSYTNTMKINGLNVSLDIAGELTNNSEISSSYTTILNATDSITNIGLIDGYITSINAANSINNTGEGRIYGDYLSLQADTINNTKENDKSAVIAAREELNIGANIINNIDGSRLLSMGTLNIGGTLDENGLAIGKAKEINNLSANIESSSDMSLSSDEINNIDIHLVTEQVTGATIYEEYVSPKSGSGAGEWFLVSDSYGIYGGQDDNYFGVNEEIAQKDAMIQAYIDSHYGDYYKGNLPSCISIDSLYEIVDNYLRKNDTEYHDLSKIIDATSSEDYTLLKQYSTTSHTELVSSDPAKIISGGVIHIDGLLYNKDSHVIAAKTIQTTQNPQNHETKGQDITSFDGSTIERTTVEADGWFGGHEREWHGEAAYDMADKKSELYSLGTSLYLENANVQLSSNIDPLNNTGYAAATPNTSLPNSALFITNPDNPDYFIQTDPRFTNYQNFLSSDYMLNQLSLDPTTLHKKLGDGYYEQKLVREQVMQLTGKRFLDGFNSDEEQYMALLNSGVEFAKEYGISVGIALSAQQIQNLTKDVVLLVAKDITLNDGTKTTALVPQLYTAAVRTTGTRSLISASNIVTNGDNDLINSGTIMATNVVNLNSTSSINNNTGNISGDYVLLNAGDDININGGNLIASSAMSLNAANDVNIRSTTYTTSNTDGQSDFSRTGIENTANIIVANNDGALWIQSGGDVNLAGVNITNNGDISWIEAGANINLLTLTVSEQNNVVWDSKNHLKEGYIGEIGNSIETKGDIVLKSGNDIAIKGSDINSLDGHVALKADNDIMIRSASYVTNYDEATYIKRSSLTGTKKTTTVETLDTTNSISSNITGKLVALDSGNDVNIIGSNIISDNGTMLNALNDINILSSTDTLDQTYYNQVKKSGLFSNGGLSVTIGKSQTSTDNKNSSTTLTGSMIGSLNGDTIITAGNEYDRVASDVISGHADEDGNFVASGDVSITAKDINIEAGEKTYSGSAVNKSKQSGLTVALSIPVVNALGDVVTSASDIGESKNARVNAMAVTNTAIDAYQAKNAIGALKGLSDVTSIQDAASATGASLSVTVGSSQSKSTTIYEGTNAVSSTVGGKNVTLKATGDKEKSDINVAGSNISGTSSTTLSADHDINILAAASTDEQHGSNKSSGWNAGAVISAEAVGVTLGGNVGRGKADGVGTVYTNSHVGSTTGTTTITAGDTTNIIGGQVLGDSVKLTTSNLNIESLQDTSTYDSQQKNISGQITVGAGWGSASGSASKSNIDADYASVNEQSGIIAGDKGYDVSVVNNTNLIGGIITSTGKAEDDGLNSFSTSSLSVKDIQNFSHYEGESIGISASASYSSPNPETVTSATTTTKTPAAGQDEGEFGTSKSIGFGSDSDSQTSTTYAGINTSNITITGTSVIPAEAGIQNITQDNIADIHTATTTDTIKENSGSLTNTFDAGAVQKELDVQVRVTQTFDTNRQEVKAEINSIIDEANRVLENDPNNQEAQKTVADMQNLGILVDSIAGALYSPSDSAAGTAANTLSPAIVYEIGQHFKEEGTEGSAEHILAQTLVAAATASLAGNDALSAGFSAGGAEVIAPILADWMYDKNPQDLTSEEKNTISAIISLGSAAVGATTGNTTDVVSSSVAGTTAVEDNAILYTPGTFSNSTNIDEDLPDALKKFYNDNKFIPIDLGRDLGNNAKDRELLADKIVEVIIAIKQVNPDEPIRLVGHSHGGNVDKLVTQKLVEQGYSHIVDDVMFIDTPVRSDYILNNNALTSGANVINLYDSSDLVQRMGGNGLTNFINNTFDTNLNFEIGFSGQTINNNPRVQNIEIESPNNTNPNNLMNNVPILSNPALDPYNGYNEMFGDHSNADSVSVIEQIQ